MKNYFISEIASAHMGNIDLVKYITNIHEKSNSNFIKYQIFKATNLFSKKNKNFKNFKKLEISFNKWEKIIKMYMEKNNIILEPFDEESYYFCKKFKKNVFIKISSSESDNLIIINDAIKNFRKVFINISGLGLKKISKLIKHIKGSKKKIIFMYGFQSYPTKEKNLRFSIFNFLKKKGFDCGYADHSRYGLNLKAINLCGHALKINKCKYIEKHVCHDIKQKPNDYITSINIKDTDKFIEMVNKSKKKIKISKLKKISDDEINYFLRFSKFAFARERILKNKTINEKKIKFLRSSSNLPGVTRLDLIENRKLIFKDCINKDEQIFMKHFY
jgi:sialic acid synthase SpsE